MFTLLSFMMTLFLMYKKQNIWLYLALFSFGFISFSLAIDGNFYGWWDYMYVKNYVENSPLIIYFWLIYAFSFLAFFLIIKNTRAAVRLLDGLYLKRLRKIGYFLFWLALIATLINFKRAGDISILFINPREWEFLFGQNVILNYIYFLHLPALVIFSLVLGKGKARRFDLLIIFLLLVMTVFHGIKFTILHGFLFFFFTFYLSRGEVFSKFIYIGVIVLFSLLLSFFIFARGGGAVGMFDYIISASVNSMYIINNFQLYEIGQIGTFIPFNIAFFEKAFYRLQGEFLPRPDGLPSSFLLNDSYNLQTALTKTGIGLGIGFIVATSLLAFLVNSFRKTNLNRVHYLFFLVLVMDVLLFTFTGWELYKLKLWFGFFICFFIDYYLTHRFKFG